MPRYQLMIIFVVIFFFIPSLFCRNTLLEFKTSYFLPLNAALKDLYKGGIFYGPEFSIQLDDASPWYVFTSIDYFKKKGRSLSLADSTTLKLLFWALGVKYLVPITDHTDFYCGLGLQPVYIRTTIHRVFVQEKQSYWGIGALGKVGAYMYLPHNILVNLFLDYNFVRSKNFYGHTISHSKSNVSSAIFGIALGYRF